MGCFLGVLNGLTKIRISPHKPPKVFSGHPKKSTDYLLTQKGITVCPQTVKKRQRTAGIRRPLHLFQQVCSCTVQQPPIKPVETASQSCKSCKSCKCTTNTTNITLKCGTVWIWKVIAPFWHRWVLLSIHVNCQGYFHDTLCFVWLCPKQIQPAKRQTCSIWKVLCVIGNIIINCFYRYQCRYSHRYHYKYNS